MAAGERIPVSEPIPEGALEGQFCANHIVTKDNPEGTDCAIWLIEGIGDRCGYESAEHARRGVEFTRPYTGGADGVCRDFRPRDFGPDSDFHV